MIGYVKVQHRYVWKNGKVSWEPIYQNVNVKVGPAYVKGSVECLYQNIINVKEEKHTYKNVNAEEPVYAELNFMPLPTQGKNGPSTNVKKHTYAKLIGVINRGGMVGRPLPPVPREGRNNLSISTNAEEHYDWPKVSYVWVDPIYKNANYVREHIYETINNQAPKIPQSEKKVQRMKNILRSIKDFFVNLFKSKKPPINDTLVSVENDHRIRNLDEWNMIRHHGSTSYVRFECCDDVISGNRQKDVSGDGPDSYFKGLNVARDTIVMSTYC